MTKLLALGGFVMLLGLAAACAGRGSEEPDVDVPTFPRRIVVAFTVSNELAPRASVTVRLRSGETTRILGSVTPGLERTFELELPASTPTPEYRLTATSVAFSDAITSESFSLSPDSWVRWTIADNSIEVGQRQETSP
jgi:hypothetical protein